ncbi:hypothetical protein C4579_03675 [Candidatus Microgenomates bacterium]|nr:MAG: hypothetical protein C4579_03675 [Candidatus Microgenomates bacterium]
MRQSKGNLKVCSRGHKFYKSSDCPVCPVCWSGYYRQKNQGDFPDKLSAPALRALLNAKIFNLKQLSKYREEEILAFHGMGPSSLPILKKALAEKGLSFQH